jgi:hypothetical protein
MKSVLQVNYYDVLKTSDSSNDGVYPEGKTLRGRSVKFIKSSTPYMSREYEYTHSRKPIIEQIIHEIGDLNLSIYCSARGFTILARDLYAVSQDGRSYLKQAEITLAEGDEDEIKILKEYFEHIAFGL